MTSLNGSTNGHDPAVLPVVLLAKSKKIHLSQPQLHAMLERLRVPFDPLVIQWKVVETTKIFGRLRGRVIPYADKLAYCERLNELVSPIGWAQNLSVQTAPIAPREKGPASAKLVVTCELAIHALGTHSSTGESWAADENGATSAEAQAFKRSCACFGLGAYLYYFFDGLWVDLDGEQRPLSLPTLPEWATPEGWLRGARPSIERIRDMSNGAPDDFDPNLIRAIEAMHSNLGTQVYRRILKGYRVWEPKQFPDPAIARKALSEMQLIEKLLLRAAYAFERLGKAVGEDVIKSFNLKSVSDFGDLATLERVVASLEEKVTALESGGF
jgi:hypothetical protein